MHARTQFTHELILLADAQAGILTRGQCLSLGLSRHSVQQNLNTGAFCRMSPGIYFCAGGRPDWMAHVWAARALVVASRR